MISPITNRWNQVPLCFPRVEHFPIYDGVEGHAYNHHAQITSLNGRLFASWSNGPIHEDSPGQHMVFAVSDDLGETWSEPLILVAPRQGRVSWAVLTAMGIHPYGNSLAAYCGYYDYDERGIQTHLERGNYPKQEYDFRVNYDTHTEIMVSDDGGASWRGPVAVIDRFVPNLGPHRIVSGRLIIPGNMWFPYTDDPAGIDGWTVSGLPRLPDDYYDDPEGFWYGKRHRGDSSAFCEASCYQTDDGVIHMMLRIERSKEVGRLAVAESEDNGSTWSEPKITTFTDANCRFHFGRLPDGRCFGVSCPANGAQRTPMVLAASHDGVVFDKHYVLGSEPATGPRLSGHHKVGRYGYPSYHILGDYVFVIYSINKEDIAVCRVKLTELS